MGAILSVPDAQPGINDGAYRVIVTNNYGAVTSDVAHLIIRAEPGVVTQPTNQTVTPCASNVVFCVEAEGGGPYTYQWYFNDTNALPEATNATLVLSNLDLAALGSFQAVVTNAVGAVTSQVVVLSYLWGDCDGDGLPDQWELEHGLAANDPADGDLDSDHDGLSNREEFQAGTDPQDDQSTLRVELVDGGTSGVPTSFLCRIGDRLHRAIPDQPDVGSLVEPDQPGRAGGERPHRIC